MGGIDAKTHKNNNIFELGSYIWYPTPLGPRAVPPGHPPDQKNWKLLLTPSSDHSFDSLSNSKCSISP